MPYLIPTLDPWTLALATAIACLSVLMAIELSRRVIGPDRDPTRLWWLGGSLVGGTGLWTLHFLSMHAHKWSIETGYAIPLTFFSWTAACGAMALVLSLAARRTMTRFNLFGDAFIITMLLFGMFFTGIAAIRLNPVAVWDGRLVAAGFVLCFASMTGLLASFAWTHAKSGIQSVVRQMGGTLSIGIGLAAMHLVTMAAMTIPVEAICFSSDALSGDRLAAVSAVASSLLLTCLLCSSIAYGRFEQRRTQLAGSLRNAEAQLVSAHDELRQQALLDALTGLPNRFLFEDRLKHALVRMDRAKKSVRGLDEKLSVLFVDIDGFKAVNDSLGHAAGDEVIRQVARRINDQARNSDTVARFGSDQFLVLMEGVASTADCVALANRVIDAIKARFHVADRRVQISVSVGIVVYPDHGDREKLLAQADTAMQAAKRAGRGTYALFESHMQRDTAEHFDLINDLRQSIELGQLELHYQPKIDGRRRLICGVEALLRWKHPVRGYVSPSVFIPIAERFGFINTLGNWVIDEACRQMQQWAVSGVHMRVAINLSVHQLRGAELVDRISAAMARHGVKSSQLLCEITESVAMQDITATQRTLDALGQLGVYLSIDDFGTGYSSLSYLRQLPARQLKIDRSFIKDLESSNDARAVVDAVVRLAHALGLRVVAEGVETSSQQDILLKLGCDELQGFFYAHPMSADKLLAWTAGRKPMGTVDFAQSLMHEAITA